MAKVSIVSPSAEFLGLLSYFSCRRHQECVSLFLFCSIPNKAMCGRKKELTRDSDNNDDKRRDNCSPTPSLDLRLVELVRSLGRKAAEDDFREELRRQSALQTTRE